MYTLKDSFPSFVRRSLLYTSSSRLRNSELKELKDGNTQLSDCRIQLGKGTTLAEGLLLAGRNEARNGLVAFFGTTQLGSLGTTRPAPRRVRNESHFLCCLLGVRTETTEETRSEEEEGENEPGKISSS